LINWSRLTDDGTWSMDNVNGKDFGYGAVENVLQANDASNLYLGDISSGDQKQGLVVPIREDHIETFEELQDLEGSPQLRTARYWPVSMVPVPFGEVET
jgi:hypothetical protein